MKRWFRNAIIKVKTYRVADCGENCDHVPAVAEVNLKLKKKTEEKKKKEKRLEIN